MKKIVFICLAFVAFSCTEKNTEQYEKIAGKWNCSSWTRTGSDVNKCKNNVSFTFNLDKSYHSKLGSAVDSGSYKISGDKLETLPAGKLEIVTQILNLSADSLELLMNQGGMEERLLLLKVK